MDEKLKDILVNKDLEAFRDYFLDKELEYYNNDLNDLVITLDNEIPEYDFLMDNLEIDERVSLSTELFTDDKAMYSIFTYKTNIYNLYFIRTEEFALDDGYGVINELRFTKTIEE